MLAGLEGRSFASFGIRARRSEKRHPFNSRQVAVELGRAVQERTGARVDLDAPDLWIDVHVLTRQALLLLRAAAGTRRLAGRQRRPRRSR